MIWRGFDDELEKLGWPFGGGGTPSTPTVEAPKGFGGRLKKNLWGEGPKKWFKGSYLRPTRLGGLFTLIFAPMMMRDRSKQMMNPGKGYGA